MASRRRCTYNPAESRIRDQHEPVIRDRLPAGAVGYRSPGEPDGRATGREAAARLLGSWRRSRPAAGAARWITRSGQQGPR